MITRLRRDQAGFSLIELLVAILIAAIAFAAFVPLFANTAKAASSDQMRVTAQSIAQQEMEQVRELQFDQLQNLQLPYPVDLTTWMGGEFNPTVKRYTGSSAKIYTVSYNVVFNPASASATSVQNAQVTVTVSWADVFKATGTVTEETVISRQFSGPGIDNMTLSPLNGLNQLAGAPTVINVYINPQDAGSNDSGIGTVTITVADTSNATFTPVTLTPSAVSGTNGEYTVSWNQSGAAANDTFSFTAQATSSSQIPGNPFTRKAQLITGQAPGPVTGLTITPGNGCLLLTWNNSTASDFAYYEIQRGTSSGSLSPLASNFQASGYIDTGLTNGTTYYYQVCVVDTDGNLSTWVAANGKPAVQTVTTPPGTPTNFSATRNNATAVLSWTVPADSSGMAPAYFIYRDGGTLPYARFAPGLAAGSTATYTDTIGYSVAHTYSVVAFDTDGLVSGFTPTLVVNTATPPVEKLTVTVNKFPATVDVVETDAQPVPVDWGLQTISTSAGAVWTGLPYGSYTITATYNGSQIIQDITLTQNTSVAVSF
ncbi:MAG: prepilin-type N-terminal cleavage/methylation domain-containing protein [Thermoleophilia bacterium]